MPEDIFSDGNECQLQIQNHAARRLQKQICGNVGRESHITDTDSSLNSNSFPLQIQTSGSKQVNSVMTLPTMVTWLVSNELVPTGLE